MKICGSLMIVKKTGQYTICGDNEISDYKIPFIFKICNIIKRYTSYEDMKYYDKNKTQLVGTENTVITKSLPLLLFAR